MKAKLIGKGFIAKIARKDECVMLIGMNNKNEFDIGRSKEADCCIIDKNISRKHAKLKFDNEITNWTIIDNKSANGVLVNDTSIKPSIPFVIKNGDSISIPTENDTYTWVYDCETKDLFDKSNYRSKYLIDKESASKSKVESIKSISHHIDESQQFQLEHIIHEKQELDNKVKEGERIRATLAKEKDELSEILVRDRQRFIEDQEKERKEFEQRLDITKKETVEHQRKEFEERLSKEKEAMEIQQKEAEATLAKKSEQAEIRIKEALQERDIMVAKMEQEKTKAAEILENERIKYENEVAQLQIAFKNEKENVSEYKEALEKLNAEFQEKINSGKKEFEASIAKEKADKEAETLEKEKMRIELLTRQEEITELREELSRKRKREEELKEDSKKLRVEEKARFLEKCNDELKCSICDDIFVEPMSLNCGHVYCQYCLESWKADCKKKKKPYTCPNCRAKITSSVRSIHLDNLIAAIFRDANEEVKKDREELLKERKAQEGKSLSGDRYTHQKKKLGEKNTSTVRNYFQLSSSPANAIRSEETETPSIETSSNQAEGILISEPSSSYNNQHNGSESDEANVNLLPILLPSMTSSTSGNIGENAEPVTRNRNRIPVIPALRSSPRLRPSMSFHRRATLSNGEVVRIRIIPPSRNAQQYHRMNTAEGEVASTRTQFRMQR